jgi:hypothetical protein
MGKGNNAGDDVNAGNERERSTTLVGRGSGKAPTFSSETGEYQLT